MDECISVIVPIYKVEQLLSRCIDSIINQTYKNLEILLIDDGSPDRCGIICDEYAKRDNRIKVVHKQNGGLSDARNKGIEMASGAYLSFIDSDDYISPFFIETLYTMCKNNHCDIAQCNFRRVYNDVLSTENSTSNIKIYTGKEMTEKIYTDYYVQTIITCNKLFKKQLFSNIAFPVGKLHEDEATIYKLLYLSNHVAVTEAELYAYFMSPNSITRSGVSLRKMDYVEALEDRMDFFKLKGETNLYETTLKKYCFFLLDFYFVICDNFTDSANELKLLKAKYRIYYKSLLFSKTITIKTKTVLLLSRISPYLYRFYKNTYCIWKKRVKGTHSTNM